MIKRMIPFVKLPWIQLYHPLLPRYYFNILYLILTKKFHSSYTSKNKKARQAKGTNRLGTIQPRGKKIIDRETTYARINGGANEPEVSNDNLKSDKSNQLNPTLKIHEINVYDSF